MASKPPGADGPHKGTWWCACGRTEPRPPLAPEETAILAWYRRNDGDPPCECPKTPQPPPSRHARHYHSYDHTPKRNHTAECAARREALKGLVKSASAAHSEMMTREAHDARRRCQCGGFMVPVSAVPLAPEAAKNTDSIDAWIRAGREL